MKRPLIAPQWRDTSTREADPTAPDQELTLLGQRVHKLPSVPDASNRPALSSSKQPTTAATPGSQFISGKPVPTTDSVKLSWSDGTTQAAHDIPSRRNPWASNALLSLLQQQASVLQDPSLGFTLEAVQDLMCCLPELEPAAELGTRSDAAAMSPPPPAGPLHAGSVQAMLNSNAGVASHSSHGKSALVSLVHTTLVLLLLAETETFTLPGWGSLAATCTFVAGSSGPFPHGADR